MKKNKLVSICFIVMAIGILLIGIGACLGGRVYGFALGDSGLIVNSNLPGEAGNEGFIEEKRELEPYDSLEMAVDFLEVRVQEADFYGIEYHVRKERGLEIHTDGNKLILNQTHPVNVHLFFSVGRITPDNNLHVNEYLILYVPRGTQFESIEVNNNSGDITLNQMHANHFSLIGEFGDVTIDELDTADGFIDVQSGDIMIGMLKGESCKIKNEFGNVALDNIALADNFVCNVENGDIMIEDMLAKNSQISTTFGHFIVGKMTCDEFEIEVKSGDCQIQDMSGKNVSISTEFGDVNLGLCEDVEAYNINATTAFGDILVNDDEMGTIYKNGANNKNRILTISCESGNLSLYDTDKFPQ